MIHFAESGEVHSLCGKPYRHWPDYLVHTTGDGKKVTCLKCIQIIAKEKK